MTTTAARGVHKIAVPTPFQVGDVNVYLLKGDVLTLVDCGPLTAEAEAALIRGLAAHGVQLADVEQVVLTHWHCDHVGLAERVVQASGATVYAHPRTQQLLSDDLAFKQHREAFFRELYARMGCTGEQAEAAVAELFAYSAFIGQTTVDVTLAEGETLPGQAGWQVVYTPGHAPDHLSLYRQADGVMVLGDHLIRHISSNAFIEPPEQAGESRPLTLMQYREALQKVAELEWSIGYAGHGVEIVDPRPLIERRLRGGEKRYETILSHVRAGRTTCRSIAEALFPHVSDQLPLILSETLGHLDWAVANGDLAVAEEAGIWVYRTSRDLPIG